MHSSDKIISYSAEISSLIGAIKSLSDDADLKSASLLNQAVQMCSANMVLLDLLAHFLLVLSPRCRFHCVARFSFDFPSIPFPFGWALLARLLVGPVSVVLRVARSNFPSVPFPFSRSLVAQLVHFRFVERCWLDFP